MENNYNYYSTFVFYDEQYRRLSIFAEDVETPNGRVLNITAIPCSYKSEFSKKEGRRRYEQGDYKVSEKFTIPVIDNMPKRTFMTWCKETYFQMRVEPVTLQLPVFTRFIKLPDNIFDQEDEPKVEN